MAFVFCQNRWKQEKIQNSPGPGHYEVQNEKITQIPIISYTMQKFIKKDKFKRQVQQRRSVKFQGRTNAKSDKNCFELFQQQPDLSESKNGKIYRNNSAKYFKKDRNKDSSLNLKILVNNHSQANVADRKGYKKIKQILSFQKNSPKILKKQPKLNIFTHMTVYLENKQKFKQELKQLKQKFNSQRKGSYQINSQFTYTHKQRATEGKLSNKMMQKSQLQQCFANVRITPQMVYETEIKTSDNSRYHTPFESRISSIRKEKAMVKQMSIPTGIEDDSFDQDSMEYIEDANPGPGTYNLSSQIRVNKCPSKVQKFGVTMQRFRQPKHIFRQAQTPITPKYPDFKKNSQAPEDQVGFGKSIKEQRSTMQCLGQFYQDVNSLENKCKKIKIQKENVGFASCKQRFVPQKQKRSVIEELEQQRIIDQTQKTDESQIKPTCNFLSKVGREIEVNTITEFADYNGQNYNCIANKIKKQKQYIEDFQISPPGFMVNQKRFKDNKEKVKQEFFVQLKEIKLAELKKKKEYKKNITKKGFKFGNEQKKDVFLEYDQNKLSPDKYDISCEWVRPSYNIKFN